MNEIKDYDSLSLREQYRTINRNDSIGINKNDNDEQIERDEKDLFFINSQFNDRLYRIEECMKLILDTKEMAYEWKESNLDGPVLVKRSLSRIFGSFKSFFALEDKNLDHSPSVNLFFLCCEKVGLAPYLFDLDLFSEVTSGRCVADIQNEFIVEVRQTANTRKFKENQRERVRSAIEYFNSANKYIDSLFLIYKRLLVIRVDLSYRRGTRTSFKGIQKDLQRLLNNRRSNNIFKHEVGYIWKIEFAELKGHHMHFLLFYNGDMVQKDFYYAREVGKYWEKAITKGTGIHFNCNKNKNSYLYCGVGMIDRSDTDLRNNLRDRVVSYLTKSTQHARPRVGPRVRVFSHGEIRQRVVRGPGRPPRAPKAGA